MFIDLFNTYVFLAVAGFFKSLWSDPAGQIFIITFIAYSTSYMLYSGYMSWFAGGYGSLMLSQYGFTAIDFLSLIPVTFVFIAQTAVKLFKFLLRYFLIYIFGPGLFFIVFAAIQGHYDIHAFQNNYTLARLGGLIWMAGAWLGITHFRHKSWVYRASIVACYAGATLVLLSIPLTSSTENAEQIQPLGINVINEFFMLMAFLIAAVSPFLIGQEIALTSVREKLLSRITRLALTQALPIPGTEPLPEEEKTLRKAFAKPDLYSYSFDEQKPVYLVSSFSQTTILYAPVETTGEQRGRLILIASSLLCSLEISGAKLDV
jgi:hypothetical protein